MNSFTRRRFLQYGTAAGAAFLVPWPDLAFAAAPTGVTPNLKKFVDRLPVPPVFDASQGGAAFTIGAGEATYYSFHSQLGPAKTWGYGGAPYLGPTINARRGYPVTVTWQNNLPGGTFLPNDPAIMGAVLPGDGPAPVAMHLHGSFSLPQFDGTPLQWFTRTGATATTTRWGTRARTCTPGSRGCTSSATSTTRASRRTRSASRPAPTRCRSSCRTRRSTPTGRCSIRPSASRRTRCGCRSSSATHRSSTARRTRSSTSSRGATASGSSTARNRACTT
jgi:hypothetical protein